VIAACSQLLAGSAASGVGAGNGTADGKTAPSSAASAFSSFLDGYLVDSHSSGASKDDNPQTPSRDKKESDDLPAPAPVPVAVVATSPLTLGLELLDHPASQDAGGDQKDTRDRAAAAAAASAVPVAQRGPLAGLAPGLDSLAALAAGDSGQHSGTAQREAAAPPSAPAPASDAASELAFSARLTVPVQGWSAAVEDQPTTPSPAFGARQPASAPQASQLDLSAKTSAQDSSSETSGNTPADARGTSAPAAHAAVSAVPAVVRTAAASGHHPQTESANDSASEAVNGAVDGAASAAASVPAGHEGSSAPQPPASVTPSAPPEPVTPSAQPASRDVSLRLGEGNNSVDIRMAERAGEIRVTVHTPDRDLAGSLRAELPDLVGKLRQEGYQAEAWRPASTAHADTGRRSGSDTPAFQQDAAAGRRDGRRPPQQQQKNQSRWDGEWNASLAPAQESQI